MEAVGVAFFVAVWLGSVVWTARDASRRCNDPSLRVVSAAAAMLVPFVGAALYVLIRPCEERLDVEARRLRVRMLQSAFSEPAAKCAACSFPVEPDFRCCPRCGESLREACSGCGGLVRRTWTACPWCATPLDAPAEETSLPRVA